jgi:hypothetical protein
LLFYFNYLGLDILDICLLYVLIPNNIDGYMLYGWGTVGQR